MLYPAAMPRKNPHAQALSRLGARLGGLARAKKLSKKRRHEIAVKAGLAGAKARWGKKKKPKP